jgi:hypothetical protein
MGLLVDRVSKVACGNASKGSEPAVLIGDRTELGGIPDSRFQKFQIPQIPDSRETDAR